MALLLDGKPIEGKDAKLALEAILKTDGNPELITHAAAALAITHALEAVAREIEAAAQLLVDELGGRR